MSSFVMKLNEVEGSGRLLELACAPHTKMDDLMDLARWSYSTVQADLTPELAEVLFENENSTVNRALASNPATPESIFRRMLHEKSTEWMVLTRVLKNESCPSTVLAEVVTGDFKDFYVYVAEHKNTTVETLKLLLRKIGRSSPALLHLVLNDNFPASLKEEILWYEDALPVVKAEALAFLLKTRVYSAEELEGFTAVDAVRFHRSGREAVLDSLMGTTKYAGYPREWLQELFFSEANPAEVAS